MSWLKKYVNNTGYLKGEETNKNPINIIPSNHITTDNMAFPIYANGVLLQPNTGDYMFPTNMVVETPAYKSGGYTVKRTNERKGKTHVVIGPGGEKRYFGDPKMGERSKSKYGKEAFYKRHAKNLDKNPFFRAYAKATWQTGGNKTPPSPIPFGYNVFATPNNIYKAPYNPLAPQTLPSDNTTNKIQVLPTNQELKATNNKKTELPIRNKSVQPTTNNNSDTLKNKISVSPQSDLAPLLFQEVRPDTSFINIKNIEDPEHYADSMIDKYRLWRNYSPSTKVNDTLINLTNLPMGWFPFNTYPGQDYTDILGNNYIETNDNRTGKPEDYAKNWKIRIKDPNDTFRNAGYAKEVGSYYHSKDIPAFYGIENDRIKVGKPEDFNENTVIVPVRNSTMPYARVDVEKGLLTDTYYTYDNAGNKIWNLNSKTKFLVHSPVTKQTIYLSNNNNPEFLKNELNKFKENNPDAYIISIDEGRFKYNINAKRANKAILDEDEFKRWTTLGGTILTDYLENIDKPVKTLQDFQGGPPIYSPIENYKYGYNIGILKHKSGGVFKDPPVNPIPSGVNVFATSNSIYKTPNNTTVNKPVEYNPVYKNLAEKNFTQQELAAINNKKPDVLKQDRSIPKSVQLTPFEQKVLEKEMEAQTFGQQRVTYNQFGEPVLKWDPSMPKATGRIEPDYMDPITMAATFGAGAYGKGLSLADAALVGLDAGTYGASNLGIGAGKLGFNAFKKLYKEVPKPINTPNVEFLPPPQQTEFVNLKGAFENIAPVKWSMQEMPGLHLKSTMAKGPISKIVEPKTGLINVEQALAIIGKESEGANKVALIKKGLGENIPKKMDYNEFRKVVQDQLIPLERQFATHSSNYGISSLGYPSPKRSSFETALANIDDEITNLNKQIEITSSPIKKHYGQGLNGEHVYSYTDRYGIQYYPTEAGAIAGQKRSLADLNESLNNAISNKANNLSKMQELPLENQTLILGNKSKFGRGSSAHGNPEETLGHIHFLRDAETPDVLTVTQIQSDAFQGTHRIMPNKTGTTPEIDKWKKMLTPESRKEAIEMGGVEAADILEADALKFLSEAEKKAKEALGSNPIQKQLLDKNHQERYLQELVDYAGKRGDVNKIRVPTSETAAKVQGYNSQKVLNRKLYDAEVEKLKASGKYTEDEIRNMSTRLRMNPDYFTPSFSPEHQTILKKYSEQPKTIKKLFGVEPKIVTDSKGNTWYEFDIPENFKGNKGEIKAFKNGGLINQANGGYSQMMYPGGEYKFPGQMVYEKPIMQKGGQKKAYNPNLASKDKAFQIWYGANTLEGQRGVPYSDDLDYDYYSFYRNGDYKDKGFSIENHFPDTYKRPSHETFSNESIYSTPENPGGFWRGDKYYPNGKFMKNMKNGGQMIRRADGSYSKRGLWDNIRANRGSGKEPTKQMLEQEKKIKAKYQNGGPFKKLNKLRVSSSLFGNKYYNQDSPNFGVNASLFKYEDIGDRYNTLNYGPEVFLNADPINRKGNIGLGVNLEGFNSQGVNVDLKGGLMSRYDNNKIKFNPYAYGEIGPYYKKRVGKGINRGEQTINPYVFLGTDFYKGPIENSTAGVGLNYNRKFNKKKNTPSIYGDAQFSIDREGGNFSSSPSRYTGYVSAKLGVSGLFSSKYKKPINKKTNTPWNYTYKVGGMLEPSPSKVKSKSWLSKYDN